MKAILLSGVFAVFALAVAGAPTYTDGEAKQYVSQQQVEDYLRQRRAPYAQFVAPCATTGGMQVPVSSVQVPAFAGPPYQGYSAVPVPQYGYATVPHYRSVDEQIEPELLGFSDTDNFVHEHVPMARLGGYGAASVASVAPGLTSLGGQVLSQATTGPALGVFPNAHVGGCAVPLLFSCSPTIVSGHIVEPQSHISPVSAGIADSYRLVDEPIHHEAQHEDMLTQEHLNLNPGHESSHATHQ